MAIKPIKFKTPNGYTESQPLPIPEKPEDGSDRKPYYLSNRKSIAGAPGFIPEEPEQISSSALTKLGANFIEGNSVGSLLNGMVILSEMPDEFTNIDTPADFNPMADMEGYEDYADRFALADNPFEVAFLKQKIDRERENKKIIEEGGFINFAAGLAAGALDPLVLIPTGGAIKGSFTAGKSLLKNIVPGAYGAMVGTSISEAALHATQETRTFGESVGNIAFSAILGGAIGGGVGAYISYKGNKNAVKLLADSIEKELTLPPEGKDLLAGDGVAITGEDLTTDTSMFKSAGAAAVNQTQAKLMSALGLEKVSFFGLLKASPTLRLATSQEINTRRGVMQIADVGLRYEHNALGIKTPAPAKTVIDHLYQKSMTNVHTSLNNHFTKYRGREGSLPVNQRTQITDSYGVAYKDNYLNQDEFYIEVSKALRRGDRHAIPEIQSAAANIRKELNYYRDAAIEAGLISDKFKDSSDYLHRIYDKAKISARRSEFKQICMDWLRHDPDLALDNNELAEAAEQVVEHILGGVDGRINYGTITTRGPMKERVFNIPDHLIEDWLVNDISIIMDRYIRTMAADITLKNHLGDLDGAGIITKIRDGYQAKINELVVADPKTIERRQSLLTDLERRYQEEIKAAPEESKSAIEEKYKAEKAFIEDATPDEVLSRRRNTEIAEKRLEKETSKIKESAWEAEKKRIEKEYKNTTDKIIDADSVSLTALKKARTIREKRLATLEHNKKSGAEPPITPDIQKRLDKAKENYEISMKSLSESKTMKQKAREKIEASRANELASVKEGDPNAVVRKASINNKYDEALVNLSNPDRKSIKKIRALEKERDSDIRDTSALISITRGTFYQNSNSILNAYEAPQIIKTVKTVNYARMLGMSPLAAITDLAGFVLVNGATRVFGDLIVPMVRNINKAFRPLLKKGAVDDSLWAQRREEIRQLGIANEVLLQARTKTLADIGGDYVTGRTEKFNRFLAKKATLFSGISHWTEMTKTSATVLAQTKILRTAMSKNRTAKEITSMAQYGLDAKDLDVIADQFRKYGSAGDGILVSCVNAWDKKAVADSFELAIRRIVNNTVITPDLEKPLFFYTPIGSILGQFKSFGVAAYQRILLAGLQRRDAEIFQGIAAMMVLGAQNQAIRDLINHGEVKERTTEEWFKIALDKSGITGHVMDIENMMDKITGGVVGVNSLMGIQPKNRDYVAQALKSISPSTGIAGEISEVFRGDGSRRISAVRRLLPFQNSLLLTKGFDRIEDWFRDTLGVRPRGASQKKTSW